MNLCKVELICKTLWLGFLLMCVVCINIYADDVSAETALEKENQAKELKKNWDGQSYRKSIDLFFESAHIWTKLGETEKSAKAIRESVRLLIILADYEKSSNELQKSLKTGSNNKFLAGKAESLSLLALVSLRNGNFEESRGFSQKALDTSRLTDNPSAKANALYAMGEFNYYYGNADETIKFLNQSLVFAEKTSDENLIAQIFLYLGFAHIRQGNSVAALTNVEKSLEKYRATGDKRGEATAHFGRGFIKTLIDEKQDALNSYQIAEQMFPKDMEWLEKGRLYNGIATIYEDYGQILQAINYRQRAFEFYGKAEYRPGQLATLPSLAKLNYRKGDKIAAAKLYDEALILARELNDDFHLAVIKEDLGKMDFDDGSFDKAIENYQIALQSYKKLKIRLPRIQNSLGKAFEKKGNIALARQYYNEALALNLKTKDMIFAAENLYNLAYLNESEGKIEDSFKQIQESLKITESFYGDVANNNLRRTYLSDSYQRYELAIHLLMKLNEKFPKQNYANLALQTSEKARTRTLIETLRLAETDLAKNISPELNEQEKQIRISLNFKADALTELLSANVAQSQIDILNSEIAQLTDEYEKIKAEIKLANPEYAALKEPSLFDVTEFQRQFIDDETVLLEFSLGEKQSYLWLISKSEIKTVTLPPQKIIEPKVRKLLELLTEREMRDDEVLEDYQARLTAAESEYQQKAKELSNELLGKVADKLANKRLLVVADGILNYFPLSALPAPNSDELLIAKNEIVYQPSASAISVLQTRQNKTASKDVMVFADAIFSPNDVRVNAEKSNTELAITNSKDTIPSSRQFESVKNLPRLDASQTEAAAISEIFGSSRSLIISGAKARRERVLEPDLADYRIVHFATHGLLDEEHPEFSSIIFSLYDEKGDALKGFLRLQDIYNLNLAADLVVLSACDSAIGKEIKGEGVVSLTRGFMQAGSKSVLSSLWKVEDNATAELMKIFYSKLLNESLTPAEALRRAQLEMSQIPRYRSPFYWAAFTLQGEYRYEFTKPSFFRTYSIYTGLAIAAILGFGGIFAYRRFYR